MNWFQKLVAGKAITQKLDELEKKYSLFNPPVLQVQQNGLFSSPADNQQTYITDAYQLNDLVYSCIQLILDKVKLPEWNLFKVEDENALKNYKTLIKRKDFTPKDFRKARDLRHKALVPITNDTLQIGKLRQLLTYPNELESHADFICNGVLYKLLTGNKFIWGDVLGKGANAGIPNAMYVLPSQHVRLIVGNKFPASPIGYTLYLWGQMFTPDQILHEKYANPNWSINGIQLYGQSPLLAAINGVIARNNSAAKATVAMFNNRGLENIIYMDDTRFTPDQGIDQIKKLKLALKNEYSGADNYGKAAISGYKVGVVPMGLNAKDMEIIAAEKWDAERICNIYGVPPGMLQTERSTFNNLKESEKALTTRSAIPLLTSYRDSYNRKIQTDWGFKGKNVIADFDINVFSELSENMVDTVNWVTKAPLTPNEQRDELGYDKLPNPEFDELWIPPTMGVPYSEFEMNEVDRNINDDGQGNNQNGNEDVPQNQNGTKGLSK